MIRAISLVALVAAAVSIAGPATAATCMVRVPGSLSSDSERSGPMVPGPCKAGQGGAKQRAAKAVDPMKLIRNRMIAGEDVSYKEMQTLADSGDDLAQFYLAKRIEEANEPDTLDAAARYYRRAAENGRTSAVRPLIRLLNANVFDEQPKNLAESKELLENLAADGDAVARDGLIAMYRTGMPFGLDPARADELLVASAKGGDPKAALDLAFALLTGTPDPAEIEEAKGYLKVAATSEILNIRTVAENLLRTLEPQLTAATETSQ
jgi:TPR repeat protein